MNALRQVFKRWKRWPKTEKKRSKKNFIHTKHSHTITPPFFTRLLCVCAYFFFHPFPEIPRMCEMLQRRRRPAYLSLFFSPGLWALFSYQMVTYHPEEGRIWSEFVAKFAFVQPFSVARGCRFWEQVCLKERRILVQNRNGVHASYSRWPCVLCECRNQYLRTIDADLRFPLWMRRDIAERKGSPS